MQMAHVPDQAPNALSSFSEAGHAPVHQPCSKFRSGCGGSDAETAISTDGVWGTDEATLSKQDV